MYFAKITHYYNSKNRLQEYLSKQLKQLECLNVADADAFKKHLETTVHRANLKFPRCTPLVSYMHPSHTNGDYSAGVGDLVQFSLYAHRGTFEPGQAPAPCIRAKVFRQSCSLNHHTMSYQIETRYEKRRGCGYRQKGGIYFVSGQGSLPCGKLPIEVTVCPCCGAGIEFSRGFT